MKNTAFYKNYRRHFNNVIKKGEITYKGEIWKISKTIVGVKPDWKAVKVETLSPIEPKSMEIEIGEVKPVRPAPPAPETLALNYESIGFAIGFKKATAKEVLELVNGNTARLIPALQWLYKQTSEEGLRKRIQEITLDVLFN